MYVAIESLAKQPSIDVRACVRTQKKWFSLNVVAPEPDDACVCAFVRRAGTSIDRHTAHKRTQAHTRTHLRTRTVVRLDGGTILCSAPSISRFLPGSGSRVPNLIVHLDCANCDVVFLTAAPIQ